MAAVVEPPDNLVFELEKGQGHPAGARRSSWPIVTRKHELKRHEHSVELKRMGLPGVEFVLMRIADYRRFPSWLPRETPAGAEVLVSAAGIAERLGQLMNETGT